MEMNRIKQLIKLLNMKNLMLIAMCLLTLNSCKEKHEQVSKDNTYHNSAVENSDAYKSGNDYQKDFLLIIDLLKTTHPAFAPSQNFPFDLDSIQAKGLNFLKDCTDFELFHLYITKIVAKLRDGHTCVMPNVDKNGLYYLFNFRVDYPNVKLNTISQELISNLGKNIIKINEYPVHDVINSFRDYINTDNDNIFYRQVDVPMQSFSVWKTNKYFSADSILSLTFSDGTVIKIKPQTYSDVMKNMKEIMAFQKSNTPKIEWHPITKLQMDKPFFYKILDKESICYFQFMQCTDNSTMRWQDYMSGKHTADSILEKQLASIPRFDTLVLSMFNEIKNKNIKTLVVDVRYNGGGNSELCDILLSYLKPLSSIEQGKTYLRFSPFFEKHYPELAIDAKRALQERNIDFKMGNIYRATDLDTQEPNPEHEQFMNKYFQFNEDKNNIFKGNIVFIQGKGTYSSAGLLITSVCDNEIGIIIGDKSSYNPCHYGDILTWQLPNTKITGSVSCKIFNRPNADKCNEKYLVPSIVLETTNDDIIQGKDKCWDWIIANYAK